MFVKSSLAVPLSSKKKKNKILNAHTMPQEISPLFSAMGWPITGLYEEGGNYGPPGAWYSESGYVHAEMQETGSDASTADTSPYLTDEQVYTDVPDMSQTW